MNQNEIFSLMKMKSPFVWQIKNNKVLPKNLQGWNGDHPFITKLTEYVKPNTAVEVGSYLGLSANNIASTMKKNDKNSVLICIDTWLGSYEHFESISYEGGISSLYDQFVSNMIACGVGDMVVALPTTTRIGAGLLRKYGIRPQMTYVDASHDYKSIVEDIELYIDLLDTNVEKFCIFGDDWGWADTPRAVKDSVDSLNERGAFRDKLIYKVYYGNFWVISNENFFDKFID